MYQDDISNNVAPEAPDLADQSTNVGVDQRDAGNPSGRADLTASFLTEIARAMRATAAQERERISATVADTTTAHEQKVRERGVSEATELRRLAGDDVARIEQTAADEIQRIKDDAERQVGERRAALADYLERHAALIESEIGRVHGAVDDYGAELDGFFGRLAEEQNPAEIVRLAGQLPQPPDLDEVGAIARADAVARIVDEATEEEAEGSIDAGAAAAAEEVPGPVGVMDDRVGTPVFDDSATPTDTEAVPAGGIAEDEAGQATGARDATSNGSSAVKLLRNIAPWTSPDRPSDEAQD
jgi:hypothetical protein